MKSHLQMRIDFAKLERYLSLRRQMDYLYELAVTPIRLPARRRREDRQVPKAA